jgi:sucrose-phosphate synthase
MHIVFLNPQGNFDPKDSYLTEHPDFGGQLVYVKELAQVLASGGHKVDIITRKIVDVEWPEFSADQDVYPNTGKNLRILRFSCGGEKFLNKEELWPHLPEFAEKISRFYGKSLPDFFTAHYADGGYTAVLLKQLTGIPFSFTGHSLGAQKLDKLNVNSENWADLDNRFHFSQRLAAERVSIKYADIIFVSTKQERDEQYKHPLYSGALNLDKNKKFNISPPGVNRTIFNSVTNQLDFSIKPKLDAMVGKGSCPAIIVSSRLDQKKNIIGVVKAFLKQKLSLDNVPLILCIRGIEDPRRDIFKLSKDEQHVLNEILETIGPDIAGKNIHFLNVASQLELAATYRYFATQGSVFALTSFYEPFGLAPIEAAAAGLAPVVTKNGGPSEIFSDGSGILVDPISVRSIGNGLIEGLKRADELSKAAIERVENKYTWQQTARNYVSAVHEVQDTEQCHTPVYVDIYNDNEYIKEYLSASSNQPNQNASKKLF